MAIYLKDTQYKEISKIFFKNLNNYREICKVYICTGPNQYELLFDNCQTEECIMSCDCDTFCSSYCDNAENGDLGCACNIHRIPIISATAGAQQLRICCCGVDGEVNEDGVMCDCNLIENNYKSKVFDPDRCYVNDICYNDENYPKGPTTTGFCWTPCCPLPQDCDLYFDADRLEHNEPCCYQQKNTIEYVTLNNDLKCGDEEILEPCSECRIHWLSIYDDLFLQEGGPAEEAYEKLICPSECPSGGLNTTCMEDEVCCDCDEEGEVCKPIFDVNCPCLRLRETASCFNSMPDYITNTCRAYTYAALTGFLGNSSTCNSCIDWSRTEIANCCKNNKKHSYIKKVVWNDNPTPTNSVCGIRRSCPTLLAMEYFNQEEPEDLSSIIDFGDNFIYDSVYGAESPEDEGGVASSPKISSCPSGFDNCRYSISNCYEKCGCAIGSAGWCERICSIDGILIGLCATVWRQNGLSTENWLNFICNKCKDNPSSLGCCPQVSNPEHPCDLCYQDPCGNPICLSCDYPDWSNPCLYWCSGSLINWSCINSSGLSTEQVIEILRGYNCPCAPPLSNCDKICDE